MTDQHYVYGESQRTQTVHLIHFHDTIVFANPASLCGKHGWLAQGDETPSGIAATCGRCRQIAHLPLLDRQSH